MDINKKLGEVIRNGGMFKFVDIGATSLNDSVLSVEKFAEFVQEIQKATTILDGSRFIPMASDKTEIDRISFEIDLEAPVRDADGTYVTELTDQNPTFTTNQLSAEKLMAKTRLTYEAVEDNISGNTLETTLVSLFGSAAGRALERVFVYGDTAEVGGSTPSGYKAVNGWIKKADSGMTLDQSDFDETDIDDIFKTMYDLLPAEYLPRAKFLVSTKRVSEYRRSLKSKDSPLGDQAVLQNGELTYEGVPVIGCPVLDYAVDNSATFFQDEAMFLTDPANLVHGMKRNVMVESDKEIEWQYYRFVLSLRGDCHYEDETKTVLARPATA